MNSGPFKSWAQSLIEFALAMAAAAWLLTWAWQLLRPLVPVLVVAGGLMVLTAGVMRRFRQW